MAEVGNALQQEAQYSAKQDGSGTWRIMNLWHADLKTFDPKEDDVPDDHPSITLLTEGAFGALVKEATSQGVLDGVKIESSIDTVEFERLKDEFANLEEAYFEAMRQLEDGQQTGSGEKEATPPAPPIPTLTGAEQLEKYRMDTITKLAGLVSLPS